MNKVHHQLVLLAFALTFIFGMYQVLIVWAKDEIYEVLDKLNSKHLQAFLKNSGLLEESIGMFWELCPNSSSKTLKESLLSILECDNSASNSMTLCERINGKTLLDCSKPLVALFEDCLSPDSKGLPTLILESIGSVLAFLCKVNGEQIFELANSCIYDMTGHEVLLEKCSRDLSYKMRELDRGTTKTKICRISKGLENCAKEKVDKSCGNIKTREVFEKFTNAVLAPC